MMRLMMMIVLVMMMVMVVMVVVMMISMVFMVEQCTHMSGNNAISCEKFTDASSPRLHFHHHRYHHQGKPTKRNVPIWASLDSLKSH